jgi:hypothetical protein
MWVCRPSRHLAWAKESWDKMTWILQAHRRRRLTAGAGVDGQGAAVAACSISGARFGHAESATSLTSGPGVASHARRPSSAEVETPPRWSEGSTTLMHGVRMAVSASVSRTATSSQLKPSCARRGTRGLKSAAAQPSHWAALGARPIELQAAAAGLKSMPSRSCRAGGGQGEARRGELRGELRRSGQAGRGAAAPRSGRAAERSGSAEQRGATRRERTLAVMGHWPWARAREASARSPSAASAREESFMAAGGARLERGKRGFVLLDAARARASRRDAVGFSHDLKVPRNRPSHAVDFDFPWTTEMCTST